jgi:glycosyltransferase involved in cell wall biosynthesis
MYRALATANAFAREGWRVTVLTATRDTFERLTGSDPESEASIDPRIEVVRIPFDPERGETDLGRWSRLHVFSPLLWNFLRSLRARVGFPEHNYAIWAKPLARAALDIHTRKPVDLVVGSANPSVDFVPGDVLNRQFGVPFVLDHRDAWHLDVYTGKRMSRRSSRSGRLETRLMKRATEAWFVNAPIRDWHAREFPDRSERYHVVANGYDASFITADRTRLPDPEALVFGYLGTIYGPIPLRESLEAWRLARSRSPLLASARLEFRGRLGHFAEQDVEAASLLDEFRADGVSYRGPVSKTKVAEVYQGFDALLLVISHSRYVTSGKVFEYAATGLPIAALHHPETATTSVLEGRPNWFPAQQVTVDAFADVIVATAEAAATLSLADIAETQAWSRHLERDEQLLPRIRALRTVAERTTT